MRAELKDGHVRELDAAVLACAVWARTSTHTQPRLEGVVSASGRGCICLDVRALGEAAWFEPRLAV
jgi:hypothetical protein